MLFEGRVMMVTGGGGGIGRATSLMAAKEGANIVSADINADNAGKVAAEVETLGREALRHGDRHHRQGAGRPHRRRRERPLRKIDILINAAGLAGGAPFLEHTGELLDHVVASHLKSMMFASQAVLPKMIEQRYGRIVNITSRAGWRGRPGTAAYGAAKAAMTGMARVMAAEFGEFGVTVNNVAPGMVLSPMTRDTYGSMQDQVDEQIRAGSVVQPHRLATEDEIAQAPALLLRAEHRPSHRHDHPRQRWHGHALAHTTRAHGAQGAPLPQQQLRKSAAGGKGPEAAPTLGLGHGAGPFKGGDALGGVAQLGEDGAGVAAALRRGRAESCGRRREQRRRPDVVNDAEAGMLPRYHEARAAQERVLVEVGDGANQGHAHARRGQDLSPHLPRARGEDAGERPPSAFHRSPPALRGWRTGCRRQPSRIPSAFARDCHDASPVQCR